MSDLPSSAVALHFTDIEGSTECWERDRQVMAVAAKRQIAMLDAAIHARGGVPFKTVGDAVQAAFPTVPQALAAALVFDDAEAMTRIAEWTGPVTATARDV